MEKKTGGGFRERLKILGVISPLILGTVAFAAVEGEDMQDLSTLITFIRELGFPVVVSCYCLWVIKSTIGDNTKALSSLEQSITRIEAVLERRSEK